MNPAEMTTAASLIAAQIASSFSERDSLIIASLLNQIAHTIERIYFQKEVLEREHK
jgi:hypothetical protein